MKDMSREGSKKNILIVRLSAMGDAAISAPLVKAYASANPECNFYMVSQPRFEAMFSYPSQRCAPCAGSACAASAGAAVEANAQGAAEQIPNLYYIPLNTKRGSSDYCGSWGQLIKFARTVKKQYGITHFADIHDVIRTKVLRAVLRLSGVRVACINKHRREREELCRQKNKKFVQIIKSQRCMEEVLVKIGLEDLHFADSIAAGSQPAQPQQPAQSLQTPAAKDIAASASPRKEGVKEPKICKIGIAPFAGHKGKEWPAEKMEEVVKYFGSTGSGGTDADIRIAEKTNERTNEGTKYKVFLYGGGKRELEIMQPWAEKYPGVELFAGKHTLYEELESMASLDVMVSMDSANMHLASLVGTPVVCIWGATHRFAGYNGWRQKDDNAVEVELPCRPCSIFGAKPCVRGDYACLNNVTPQMVIDKILTAVKQ